MKILNTDFMIIVVGNCHNPTILNPDFLIVQDIVREEWGFTPKEKGIFTSVNHSRVEYKEGITIVVEPSKAIFLEEEFKDNDTVKIADIASNYLSVLKHVKYTEVEIGFRCIIDIKNPATYINTKFFKENEFQIKNEEFVAADLTVAYKSENGQLSISLMQADIDNPEEFPESKREVIVAKANYHHNNEEGNYKNCIKHISKFQENWDRLIYILNELLGE